MVGQRWLLFALFAIVVTLANGAKRGPGGGCKNCIKNQLGHHAQRLIASPINLLNPDRYEFFTLDDKGKVVKRIMTFKEIQSIVAGSDDSGLKLMENTNNNDRIVSSVVSNVRNVLNNELNLMHSQDSSSDHHNSAAELPISEMINDQDESSDGSSVEYTQDKSSEESPELTTRRPTAQTTVRIKEQPTESTTKRWTSKTTTTRPTEGTRLETVRTTERTTIRPTISSTERSTEPSTVRPTESSTIRTTTEKVRPTTEAPVRSTTEQPKVRLTTPDSTTAKSAERTTARSTVRPTTEQSTTQKTTVESVQKLSTERRLTTTTTVRPTETPMLKQAERSTTTVKPTTEKLKITEASTVTTSTSTTTTTTTTTTERPTEKVVVKATNKPLPTSPVESSSTEKSSEQSGDYSTLRSEEATNGSSMEYSTEDSSEKSGYEQSSEATRYTEVKSSVGSTVGLKTPATTVQSSTASIATNPTSSIVITTESGKVSTTVASKPNVSPSTPSPTKYEVVSSTTKAPPTPSPLGAFEALKDLVGMVLNTDSDAITTPSLSSTLPNDLVAHYVTHQVSAGVEPEKTITPSYGKPATLPEVTTVEAIALEETIPTTTSIETDASTVEDSTGYGSDESEEIQQSTEGQLDRETTATGTDVTYKPSQTDSDLSDGATTVLDSSTIPSDAQHAIHKIIESLQSINDDSNASDESESEMSEEEEQSYPIDMAGLNYDTDAQSSINAIIQSLGQGSLVSGESSLLATTTEFVTTTEEVPSTVSRAPEKKTTVAVVPSTSTTSLPTTTTTTTARTTSTAIPTTSKVVLKTSAPAVAVEKEPSSSGLNFNTNIMDTIEKFLSKFANLPSDETYSMNLTKVNPLSNYPADLNMTDYVDRTATVASVLKFPQTRPLNPTIEVEQREDPPNRPPQSLTTQSLLNETVASFMKLGEMLTMANSNNNNNRVNGAVEPQEGPQLELKTVVDEEETELLRFLSICGNLGTNVYDYLTGPTVGERSLEGRSLVYSPFATITTLSMLFLGTRGATAESINGVIGLDEMTSFNPHLFFKSIVDDLKPKHLRRSTVPGVEEQRGSFFSRTLLSDKTRGGLQRFFKARIQEIYSAVAETVDFQQKDTLLKHLSGDFPRDYVDTLKHLRSPLVSISRNRYRHDCNDATTYGVMNFKQSPADAAGTITIPSVSFRSGFSTGFSKTVDATILSLPGATSNVSVFFLKPSAPGGLTDLESHIRTQSVSAVLKLFPDETVRTAYAEVQLPYFTQTTMYNMSRSIQQLGLQNLFQPNVANFNGLQDSAVSNLHLSETVQTDSFALCASETGTERGALPFRSFSTNLVKYPSVDQPLASASPDKLMRRNRRKILYRDRSAAGAPRAQESKLTFDTPFLYLVRHNPTGLILYMGRFVGNNSDK